MRRLARWLLGAGLIVSILSCNLSASLPALAPRLTATPSLTSTLAPSPTPAPTFTPIPAVRIQDADQALWDGDTDTAILNYRAAFSQTGDPGLKAAALWGLARAQSTAGRNSDVLATLGQLISDYPQSPYGGPAYFLEAQTFSVMKNYSSAAQAYQSYLSLRPGVIDSYVQELRGDALTSINDYSGALNAYQAAQAAPHLDDAFAMQVKIAQTRAAIGDYATALSMYSTIQTSTNNDYTKAHMDYLQGEALLTLKKNDTAYGFFRDAVSNYPVSAYAYLSLIELVNANQPVDDLDRGLTDYWFAAQNNYAAALDPALNALDRYIAATPGNDGTVHYYRALTLEAMQNDQAAVNELTYFIQHYSSNPHWYDAWMEKSQIEWNNLNDPTGAAQTLFDYVQAAPASANAAGALMRAGYILEGDNQLNKAADTWERVPNEYPGSDQVATAVFLAGIMRYREAKYSDALDAFTRSLALATATEDQARADLWIGKAQQKLGNTAQTQSAWQTGLAADPGGYYSERARDLLTGRAPFAPVSASNLHFDLASQRQIADSWVRLTFNLPAGTELSGPGPLALDPRLVRGTELWDLGQYQDARLEFEDLRSSVSSDPVLSYRLAGYLLDLGLYRSGIFAARQVLTLAGLKDNQASLMAPPYFNQARYGLYYNELVVPAAQANGFDPLFLFSVMRQESLFEGFVRSTAGARGLMQIIPGTGANAAAALGWPLYYDPDQLYLPVVSVKLGAYYLAHQRDYFGGDLYVALAAYNSGPGNAAQWKQLSGGDPDLFLEILSYDEARQYIQSIYEIYAVYRRLYSPTS